MKFIETAKSEPFYYALFLVMYHMGLRKNEVVALRWNDIFWEHSFIHVRGKGNKWKRK
ncbi:MULTISPECIES: tyrosine-type recombinase/integrase [Thermodesulfobacterium]|uniref:tyrosine-type recombinase/integrase n=1 Tax=Thermodesulfobacterium TaxID=1740 RepID=UPI0009DF3DAE